MTGAHLRAADALAAAATPLRVANPKRLDGPGPRLGVVGLVERLALCQQLLTHRLEERRLARLEVDVLRRVLRKHTTLEFNNHSRPAAFDQPQSQGAWVLISSRAVQVPS